MMMIVILLVSYTLTVCQGRLHSGQEIVLDKKDALSFYNPLKGNIEEECYDEGCSFEEVVEHFGHSEKSYEYWNTYQCKKFNKDCDDLACRGNALGMQTKNISGARILASSWYSPYVLYLPSQGRLNNEKGSWCPKLKDKQPYLQMEFPSRHGVCAVATQGSALNDSAYVTDYEIQTSLEGKHWVTYRENGTNKVFLGNTNSKDMVKNNLDEPVLALFIRFVPKAWEKWPCMRVEAYGEAANCTVRTTDNKCCVFPFLYEGERRFTCLSYSFGRKWCATTYNYDEDSQWGKCLEEDLD